MYLNHQIRKIEILLIFSLLFLGCSNRESIQIIKGEEFDREGVFINDSIPNGKIKFFLSESNVLAATREYDNGKLNGESINYYNGKIIQILYFENGYQIGLAHAFDSSTGILKQSANYYFDKQMGPNYNKENNGSLESYSFKSFDNKELFWLEYNENSKLIKYDHLEKLENFTLESVEINNQEKLRLFTYLIYPPKLRVSYKINYFNSEGVVVDSLFFNKNEIFREEIIEYPNDNSNPAFIIDIFDSINKTEKTIITEIKIKN